MGPLGIQVQTEVQLLPEPPRADIILLRRQGRTWTEEQWRHLADGLRDTDADRLLIEFKYSETFNDRVLKRLLLYDHLYQEVEKLERRRLRSFLICSKTPGAAMLERHGFETTGKRGVYASNVALLADMRVILLNELADEPHNAPIKCFASREREKERAFETMNRAFFPNPKKSALARVIFGLSRIMMAKVLEHPNGTGWTPEEVMQLGEEWIKEKFIEALRKMERREGKQEGKQEGGAMVFLRLLEEKHGPPSDRIRDKALAATLAELEKWSLRLLKSNSLDDVFRP